MIWRRLFSAVVCAFVFSLARAANDEPPTFRYGGGDGSSPKDAIFVIGDINEDEFVSAVLAWYRSTFPGAKTDDYTFPCIDGKPFRLFTFRLKSNELKRIYFDASRVRDESTVNGKVYTRDERANQMTDQIVEQVEKSNMSPEKKRAMIESMRRDDKPRKRGECE